MKFRSYLPIEIAKIKQLKILSRQNREIKYPRNLKYHKELEQKKTNLVVQVNTDLD